MGAGGKIVDRMIFPGEKLDVAEDTVEGIGPFIGSGLTSEHGPGAKVPLPSSICERGHQLRSLDLACTRVMPF